MVGGTVVQVVTTSDAIYVEVLEHVHMDRVWRKLATGVDVQPQDNLWWQSYKGYLTRGSEFKDRDIGSCRPANPHGR